MDEEAIADYTKSIELNATMYDVYYNRGLAKYMLKRYDEAITDFNISISMKTDHSNCLSVLPEYEISDGKF